MPEGESLELSKRAAANIKKVRERLGWSQEKLAKRCVPPTVYQQIDKLETGERRLTIDWLEKVARALDVDALELMGGVIGPELALSEQVANEIARTLALVAREGEPPEPGIVQALSLMLQELTVTFSKHPQAYRDPLVARPVVDLASRRYAPLAS